MSGKIRLLKDDSGFTLVELMVVILLTAIAVISIYRGYTAFSQAADAQQQIMEMQQNLRIGMSRLVADLRRAGINEEDGDVAGFVVGNTISVEFSMDLGSENGPTVFGTDGLDNDDDGEIDEDDESMIGDGDITDNGEQIKYFLTPSTLDNTTNDLIRSVWAGGSTAAFVSQTLITNVEALNFVYWDAGTVGPPAVDPDTLDAPLSESDLKVVDRVDVTLVVRTSNEDYRYINTETYRNLENEEVWPAPNPHPNDNFRRRAFSMKVQIRNNI
ncbi:MAG: PilW family protein [Deltaproteobacteria bacterium]|jgi:type IV pilus assembly protein PilW|nr:PilW family protein [Deltaproteobacteria bacterium]